MCFIGYCLGVYIQIQEKNKRARPSARNEQKSGVNDSIIFMISPFCIHTEKQPPFAIEARATLKVTGVCDGQNKQFLQEMSRSIMDLFQRDDLCVAQSENKSLVICSEDEFTAVCPHEHEGAAASDVILVFVTVKVFNK